MEQSIDEIQKIFKAAELTQLPCLLEKYSTDTRSTVAKICAGGRKRILVFEKEEMRTKKMHCYEEKYAAYTHICGIDEVGRGPLAGPVVAGAVILPEEVIYYLDDSKKLTEAKREKLYAVIIKKAISTGIGMIGPKRIDEINILQATYEAMQEAINSLQVKPDILLNDAVLIPKILIKQIPIIQGDAKSVSIAAASIIAKVTRDRLMLQYDEIFPEYGFASNKGYGTPMHIEALKKYGPSPIHRESFIKNFV